MQNWIAIIVGIPGSHGGCSENITTVTMVQSYHVKYQHEGNLRFGQEYVHRLNMYM